MHVAGSDQKLRSLLTEQGVQVGRSKAATGSTVRSAWEAFQSFATIPIADGDLASVPDDDMLLYESGVYDWGDEWGKTFEVSFVRQYITPDDDIQQVHLVVHFPADVGRGVPSSAEWLPRDGDEWIAEVEGSPAFKTAISHKPLGFEVWQESAE